MVAMLNISESRIKSNKIGSNSTKGSSNGNWLFFIFYFSLLWCFREEKFNLWINNLELIIIKQKLKCRIHKEICLMKMNNKSNLKAHR